MENTINQLDVKRENYRKIVNEALARPSDKTNLMITYMMGKEFTPKKAVRLKGFTLDEAGLFMKEVRSVIVDELEKGRDISFSIIEQLDPDRARKRVQEMINNIEENGGDSTSLKGNIVVPRQNFADHEMAHITEAQKRGINLGLATLDLYFIENNGTDLSPVITFRYPPTDPVSEIYIALAPEELSQPDIVRIVQIFQKNRQEFLKRPKETARMIREFNKKTKGTDYNLIKTLLTGKL